MSRYAITTCTSENYQRYGDPAIIAEARRRRAMEKLRARLAILERETDPDLLEAIDEALDNVLWYGNQ